MPQRFLSLVADHPTLLEPAGWCRDGEPIRAAVVKLGNAYDRNGHGDGALTSLNAYHLLTVRMVAEMAAALGDACDADRYRCRAAEISSAMRHRLFDPEHGWFRDGNDNFEAERNVSQTANLLAAASDWMIWPCAGYAASVPWSRTAAPPWESWGGFASRCQGIGAAPAGMLARYVVGLSALEPGFARIGFHPRCGHLRRLQTHLQLPDGPVQLDWNHDNNDVIDYHLHCPASWSGRPIGCDPAMRLHVSYGSP
jgi:hypothetical protein